jgi:hypothetical protein
MRAFNRQVINLITAFFLLWAVQLTIGITVRNPLTVVLFVCMFLAKEKMDRYVIKSEKSRFLNAACFGVPLVFSAISTLIVFKRASEGFSSSLFKLMTLFILLAGFYCLFFYLVRALELIFFRKNLEEKPVQEVHLQRLKASGRKEEIKLFWAVALVCFLFFLPYFLYEFPGIMTADSMVQFEQIFGDEPVSNHHPFIHTLAIGYLIKLGFLVTGDMNTAIAFYTVAQMIFMCLCYGALVLEVTRISGGIDTRIAIALTLILAAVPYNGVFAVTMWKDVPFAGISILLSCLLIEMYRVREGRISAGMFAAFSALGILFGLLRSNAYIAMIAFVPVFLFTFRKHIRGAAITAAIVILVTSLVKGPLYKSFGIGSPDFTESLSVPLQQVARVLVEDRPVEESDLAMIDAVIDRTYIKELYAPGFADNIKELVRAGHPEVIEDNKKEYLGLWARLFFKNPGQYISAWYDLVGGYIYPDVAYDVGNIDGIISNDQGLFHSPVIGGKFIKVKEILIKLSDFMPLYGMLFSIGAYTWVLVITFVIALRRRKCVIVHVLMGLIIATLLVASPVVDFRYAYAVVLTSPLFIATSLSGRRSE